MVLCCPHAGGGARAICRAQPARACLERLPDYPQTSSCSCGAQERRRRFGSDAARPQGGSWALPSDPRALQNSLTAQQRLGGAAAAPYGELGAGTRSLQRNPRLGAKNMTEAPTGSSGGSDGQECFNPTGLKARSSLGASFSLLPPPACSGSPSMAFGRRAGASRPPASRPSPKLSLPAPFGPPPCRCWSWMMTPCASKWCPPCCSAATTKVGGPARTTAVGPPAHPPVRAYACIPVQRVGFIEAGHASLPECSRCPAGGSASVGATMVIINGRTPPPPLTSALLLCRPAVETRSSGQDALTLLRERQEQHNQVDLVLSDVYMPGERTRGSASSQGRACECGGRSLPPIFLPARCPALFWLQTPPFLLLFNCCRHGWFQAAGAHWPGAGPARHQ